MRNAYRTPGRRGPTAYLDPRIAMAGVDTAGWNEYWSLPEEMRQEMDLANINISNWLEEEQAKKAMDAAFDAAMAEAWDAMQ